MSNLAGTTWLFKDNISLPITNRGCEVSSGSFFRSKTIHGIEISVTSSSITYEYELNAGGSISRYATIVYSNGAWGDAAYKTITFTDDPTSYTPDKNTFMYWLNENATPIFELSGKTWLLKDKISLAGDYGTDWIYAQGNTGTYDFIFTSNFKDVKKISVSTTSLQHTYYHYQEGHDRTESVYNGSDSTWMNVSCKTMKYYNEPIYYYPDKFTFFKWFNDNVIEEKDLLTKTSELIKVADAVRKKAGNNDFLSFPTGFVNTINNIVTLDHFAESRSAVTTYFGDVSYISPYTFASTYLTTVYCSKCLEVDRYAFEYCSNLTTADFPKCTTIRSSAFIQCRSLSHFSAPLCETIEAYVFTSDDSLSDVYLPNCSSIGSEAFRQCSSLTSVAFPKCSIIDYSAFYQCINLTTASFDNLSVVGYYAFQRCSKLSSVYMPNCRSISNGAFYNCTALQSISLDTCTHIGERVFFGCTNLQTAFFSACSSIAATPIFDNCPSLTTISFPVLSIINSNVFTRASMTYTSFPNVTLISSNAFGSCVKVQTFSFPKLSTIGFSAFKGCTRLISLYLLGSSVVTLSSSTAFSSTPIGGYSNIAGQFGSVFVPASLYNTYITATNWSLISSRIVSV